MRKLLSIFILVFLVSLLIGCSGGNGVLPPPSQQAEKFVGMWVNEDQQNIYIIVARCNIELIGKKLYIDIWTRVGISSENYIGQFVVDSNEANDGDIEITFASGFGDYVQIITRINDRLKIHTTYYPFNPTGSVWTEIDYLIKTS
ncbi:MAG: hypothetical protein WC909_03510 [Candidatus Paceibacterota bacterium]|jgi:hypothetical protein